MSACATQRLNSTGCRLKTAMLEINITSHINDLRLAFQMPFRVA
jgi:hypothetical protein